MGGELVSNSPLIFNNLKGGWVMLFDIHSHILPSVDDGAKDLNESIELLTEMQKQGISCVLATPHFYPQDDNLSEFLERINKAYAELKASISVSNLPKVLLGCEMFYFKGIGSSYSLQKLCLNGSQYLLLELVNGVIDDFLFEDLDNMIDNLGIIPIIAHIERYRKAKKYRKLLKYVKEHKILTQINAESFFISEYKRTIKKLFKMDIVSFIATDAHSIESRPPMLKKALNFIEAQYGTDIKERLIENSDELFKNIISSGETDA